MKTKPLPATFIRSTCASCALGASLLLLGFSAQGVPPPSGVAPVVFPAGGFGIDGDVLASTPAANGGDWLSNQQGAGGVLDATGAPLNPATTFHFVDLYNSGSDNTFASAKWMDNPNTWRWVTGKASAKTDINNVLMHIATDANGHSWLILAGDRYSTSGDSYIDFEFLQNSLVANGDGTFTSSGPNGGRTINDLLLSLEFVNGGGTADFFAYRWQTNRNGGFTYVDSTASLPAGRVFAASSPANTSVPFGAFGQNTYAANQFVEAAVDLTALIGDFDPCLSIGVDTIMVKTKSSATSSAPIEDFINPIHYTLRIGPDVKAGPAQSKCSEGAATSFALQGQATPGLQPITSTTWSVVSGSATIDSTGSLSTTAHVSSSSATLRLSVLQANGCIVTSDIVLTVQPNPTCAIAGASTMCPSANSQFFAPPGLATYSWSISGNGSISGSTNNQMVTVVSGPTCGAPFTLVLNVANSTCSSSCSTDVLVGNTVPPSITAPPDLVLECPANTGTNSTGVATATGNCGQVTVTYADTVTSGCGSSQTISRLWTATDVCGNTATATQQISVRDTTPPIVIAPANVTISCGDSLDPAVNNVLGVATASDTCSGVSAPAFTDAIVPGSCAASYTVKRTWKVTDACGNVGIALQTITVQDITPPVLSGVPANVTVECSAVPSPASPSASDSCDPNPKVTLAEVSTQDPDATKAAHYNYTITRTWTATDACGNHSSQSQTIAVQDMTPPVLSDVPTNVTVECSSVPVAATPSAGDLCDPNPTVTFAETSTQDPDATQSAHYNYTITRTWTATDASGNHSSQSQVITVQDTTAPTLSGQGPALTIQCPAPLVFTAPTATDTCDPNPQLSFSDATTTGACAGTYTVTRTWTAMDVSGNVSLPVSQSITVQDLTAPVVTAPADITIACSDSHDPAVNTALGIATAADDCSGTSTPSYTDQIVAGNCPGNYTVRRTWSSQDGCGNVGTALQIITVQDTTPPTIAAPADLALPFTADISTNSTGIASAQDGCSGVTLNYSDAVTIQSDGSQVITRTWVAVDGCSNSASAAQTITLNAPSALILPAQTNIVLTDLTPLTVINTATNPNVPANPITYQLVDPPAGASIDSNGVITWTPTPNESPSTNTFTTVVSTTATSAAGTSTISTTNSFVVIVTSPYDGIDLSNPTDALADTDGDGLTNLIEYSVGSDPRNPADANTGIIVWITQDSGNHYLAMKFKRRTNAASLGLQYFPEVSADKLSWAGDNANVLQLSVDSIDSQFDWVTVRDVTPITPAAARFIHLRVILNSIESSSPTWIGTATTLSGNGGSGSRLTTFSQRMVLPIVYAGTVSSLQNTALTDTNASWTTGQFGNVATPAYAEFNNGWMVDISDSASVTKSLSLAGNLTGMASPGDAYRLRQHFTIASLFGTNNETGLKSGESAANADTILLQMAQSQATMTIFYYSNQFYHGWVRGDLSPADDQVIYPEEGVMVVRIAPDDVNLYACGPIKTGVAVAPIQPGYNLVGTLKSLSTVNLDSLNLYTGDQTTGMTSGVTPSTCDNLLMVKPDGTTSTFFYYNQPGRFTGWVDGSLNMAGTVPVPAGSAFFIKRLGTAGTMNWTIPAE